MIGSRARGYSKSLREDFPFVSHLSYLELAVLIFRISALRSEVRPLNATADGSPRLFGSPYEFSHVQINCLGSSIDLTTMNFWKYLTFCRKELKSCKLNAAVLLNFFFFFSCCYAHFLPSPCFILIFWIVLFSNLIPLSHILSHILCFLSYVALQRCI